VGAHRINEAGHLFDSLALGPKGNQDAGDLDRGHLTRHDLVHDSARFLTRERCASEQLFDRLGRGEWLRHDD
jgi:hypothetical protein